MHQGRRRDPARQAAQLGQRAVELGLGVLQDVGQRLGVALPGLGRGQVELDPGGDEQLLGAVVEVALDPAAGVVGRRRGCGPGSRAPARGWPGARPSVGGSPRRAAAPRPRSRGRSGRGCPAGRRAPPRSAGPPPRRGGPLGSGTSTGRPRWSRKPSVAGSHQATAARGSPIARATRSRSRDGWCSSRAASSRSATCARLGRWAANPTAYRTGTSTRAASRTRRRRAGTDGRREARHRDGEPGCRRARRSSPGTPTRRARPDGATW